LILAIIVLLQVATIQQVTAQPLLISITADGNVEGTSAITRNGNVYTLTSNLEEGSIVIEASNIVLDGAGFTLGEIYRIDGDNVEIKNLKMNAEVNAIEIYGSGCKILDNEIQAGYTGIRIRDSNSNVISGNKIDAEAGVGIAFETSSNNEATKNSITSSIIEGVSLTYSDYNTFSGNDINFVHLYHSSHNTFVGNNLPQGIAIRVSSNYNKITGNSITDFNELNETSILSSGSIKLERSCEGNVISSNTIVNSGGIFLDTSSNNVLRNNSVSGTGIGFEVSGSPQPKLSSFINDIDTSNTINGKKIYYLINKNDLNINPSTYPNIGYLALVNCTRMIVENIHLNVQGILLAWTTDSQITNNEISSNYGDGVILNYASNNKIMKNNINANSGAGIRLSYSNQNIVSGNHITRNQMGIFLVYSADNNTITENNIADQDIGINFYTSSNNLIYHNNFVNNTKQVYDAYWETLEQPFSYIPPSENIWDNDYPIGGNYWSNYTNLYPEAEELDSSGIWETPYIIDENNQDRYPLINPLNIPQVQVPEAPDGETSTTPSEDSFPTTLVVASTITLAVISVGLLVYFKKRKHAKTKRFLSDVPLSTKAKFCRCGAPFGALLTQP
jgi:parallel beta-helix repeat protein